MRAYVGLNIHSSINETKRNIKHLIRKYRSLIVDAGTMPQGDLGKIVKLKSLEDLVKISQSMIKPIVHITKEDKHVFYVIDKGLVYLYEHQEQPLEPGDRR